MGVVDSLCSLPAGDCNYTSALESATKAQLQLAIQIMKMNEDGHHQTRIAACEKKIKSFDEKKNVDKANKKVNPKSTIPSKAVTANKKAVSNKPVKKEPEKIVAFPGEKPKIKPLEKSKESHSYAECEAKLLAETKDYTDVDNRFVIDGILAKCKEDADFRNNVCRKDKTYLGFLEYMMNAAAKGYCIMIGKTKGMLTKEKALDLAYDYYNMSEILDANEKKEVAKKLTKEVNKIAEEVNEENEVEEAEEEPVITNDDMPKLVLEDETQDKADIEEEETGQLHFNF